MPAQFHFTHLGLLGVLSIAACGTMVDANGAATLALQAATSPQSAISASERSLDLNGDQLVITNVELVAREIELEGNDGACDDSSDGADSSSVDCNEIEVGPVLLELPLTPGASQVLSTAVSAGTYHEVKFRIDVPDDDAEDAEFRSAHPEFTNMSIRVTGTFNGSAFTFTSRVEAEQKLEFAAPLVVGDGTVDLTIFVDVNRWFLTADGTSLIDPALALAGQPMQAVVENNIKASFQAFEDHDQDGADDHSGPGR